MLLPLRGASFAASFGPSLLRTYSVSRARFDGVGLFVPKPTRDVICHRTYCA